MKIKFKVQGALFLFGGVTPLAGYDGLWLVEIVYLQISAGGFSFSDNDR